MVVAPSPMPFSQDTSKISSYHCIGVMYDAAEGFIVEVDSANVQTVLESLPYMGHSIKLLKVLSFVFSTKCSVLSSPITLLH